MSRDTAIWTMTGCLLIPAMALGAFRGISIMKAYRGIYVDLKSAGMKLSQAELQALIKQLYRNPKAVVASDGQAVSRRIKETHVQILISSVRLYRFGLAAVFLVGIVVLFLFDHLWPNR